MKALIILLFSVLFFSACKKEQSEIVVKQQAVLKEKPIRTQPLGMQLEYVATHQNGVFDTSSTSIKAALVEQQMFAKMIEENTYQASLLQDRINQKVKKLKSLEIDIDSSINKLQQFTKLNKKRREGYEIKYAVLE